MSLYYAIKMFNNWPYFRWNTALGLVFGTALGISIRIGGLLSVAIFIMHGGLKYIQSIGLGNILTSILEIFQIYMELIQYLPEDERNDFFISLFTMLYEVAIADDGKLNYPEEKIFQALYSNFGIPLEYQDLIKRTAQYNYNARKVNKDKPASVSPEKKFKDALEFYGLKDSYTKEELEKAWKKMALLYHPDKYHNSDPEVYRVMNEKFVQAKEIYEFLLNKIK
jgi:hypothetical protein